MSFYIAYVQFSADFLSNVYPFLPVKIPNYRSDRVKSDSYLLNGPFKLVSPGGFPPPNHAYPN